MRSAPRLQFLRPFAWKPRVTCNPAYLRFYHAARHQELVKANALQFPRIRHDGNPMRIPEFREKYQHMEQGVVANEEVIIRGRAEFVRVAGSKLVFIVVRGEFEQVQVMLTFRLLEPTGATSESFKSFSKLVARGDIISVTGKATRTSTGELTVVATRMPEILTPGLVPLPVKLEDEGAQIQRRHVDMLVNRRTVDTLRLRSYLIKYIRDFFHERSFLEFQTPILAEASGGALATPFVTSGEEGSSDKGLSLRIAPELWLKRLVVGGIDRVFELGPSFRNEGIDQTHNPEFTTCEFYQAYANLEDLLKLTEDLVCGAAKHCHDLAMDKLISLPAIDLAKFRRPFKQMEFIPSLESALELQLPDLTTDTAFEDVVALLKNKGVPVPEDSPSLTKLLDKLAATHVEPHSMQEPVFITNHPVCMSPLSKSFVCPKTGQTVSARAELFINSKEMANMYEEENDPFAQRQKFIDQAKANEEIRGQSLGEEDVHIDESYVEALESGLPPTGGWGCGVERLVMLFSGTRRISDALPFGNLRNVVAVSGLRKPAVVDSKDVEEPREQAN
ncbi:lysyl-tRNA synthetase [Podospora aff. communis PSN243]|uniref:Lysyl-tRNA synthetase n=1 Tax=Podospora aff. communis PSN243 TaxID=3040156 RepID=A0AAV9H1E4_9PEZI|nr:lysyl-tRNA synthetase [Podospora aff. communis PSN243]